MFLTALMQAAISPVIASATIPGEPVASAPDPTIRAEFVDHQRKNGYAQAWYRYDIRFTNEGSTSRTLSLCPDWAALYPSPAIMKRAGQSEHLHSNAFAFERGNWRFSCSERELGQGESLLVSIYFRHWDSRRTLRPMRFTNSLGTFELRGRKVVPIGGPRDPREL